MMEVKCVTSIFTCADNAFIVVYMLYVTLTDPESARHLTPSSSPQHQHTMEDMKITQNHAYAISTNTTDVEYYATNADNQVLVSPSKREVTTHLPAAAFEVSNECYSTSHLILPSHVCQEQDMQLTQNQAYVTSASVSVKPNESYGITTTPMDSDLLYATVEGEHNTTHTSQQPKEEEYDYVIP